MKKVYFIFLLLVLFLAVQVKAEIVVVNSKNWQDIFSGILYSQITGKKGYFIHEPSGSFVLEKLAQEKDKKIFYIKGEKQIAYGFEIILRGKGFDVKTYNAQGKNTAIDLARKAGVKNFIIVDGVYGYNAIAAAQYAILTKSFILFADRTNVDEIISVFNELNAEKIILVGRLDAEIREALENENFKLDIINNGNKIDDSIELAERFLNIKKVNQVHFTQGDIIEISLMDGKFPTLIVGTEVVPDSVINFLKSRDEIETGVMIGGGGTSLAKFIRDKTGINTFVKLGIIKTNEPSVIYNLPLFKIPVYDVALDIVEVNYNLLTNKLEVTYENPINLPLYFLTVQHRILLDEKELGLVGDENVVFLDKNEKKTLFYDVDLVKYKDKKLVLDSTVLYGERAGSLDVRLNKKTRIGFIEVEDNSFIELEKVFYDKRLGRFELFVKNTGETVVYVKPSVTNILVEGVKENFAGNKVKITQGKTSKLIVNAKLTWQDLKENPQINVLLLYGERKNALINELSESVELVIKTTNYLIYIIGITAILIIMIIILIRWKRNNY